MEALSAQDALTCLAEKEGIDLVLTDFAMPGMNGLELLKKIRETHEFIPVIMMTAFGNKDVVADAIRNRCDGFLDKPFTLEKLLEEIDRKLGE